MALDVMNQLFLLGNEYQPSHVDSNTLSVFGVYISTLALPPSGSDHSSRLHTCIGAVQVEAVSEALPGVSAAAIRAALERTGDVNRAVEHLLALTV